MAWIQVLTRFWTFAWCLTYQMARWCIPMGHPPPRAKPLSHTIGRGFRTVVMAVCSNWCHSSYVLRLSVYVCIRRGVSQRLMHFFIRTWRTADSAITRACVTAVIVSLAVARCSQTTLSHATRSRLNHILSRNCLRSHASEVRVTHVCVALRCFMSVFVNC